MLRTLSTILQVLTTKVNASMSSATFTQTRNNAVNLEKQTEVLLVKFSKFQQLANSVEADDEETSLVAQIADLLQKREDVVGNLNRISEVDVTISTSKLQQLQRHRETLAEHRLSFSKLQNKINDERNRNNLLFLIQSDISAHKQRNVTQLATNDDDYILDERRRVDTANSFADRLLQQAYETRDELMSQRAHLQNASTRIQSTLQTIPGINVLLSRINTRRKRDTLILAFVIALCIIGLFFFA